MGEIKKRMSEWTQNAETFDADTLEFVENRVVNYLQHREDNERPAVKAMKQVTRSVMANGMDIRGRWLPMMRQLEKNGVIKLYHKESTGEDRALFYNKLMMKLTAKGKRMETTDVELIPGKWERKKWRSQERI